MTYRLLETAEQVVLEPDRAGATVVWLHGLGADGHDFAPIAAELALPAALGVRYVFPHARVRPVTVNRGYEMRAWYDIRELSAAGRADAQGLAESVAVVHGLLDAQVAAGVPAGRLVVAGFSQGGAVALHAALSYPVRLAGVLAASTYLPLADELGPRTAPANAGLGVLGLHGLDDDVVAPELGRAAHTWLVTRGYRVEWHEYPMAHEVCAAELRDIQRWLIGCLG